jgi:CubicO group peptidase (beta-lactamase class C family)
VYRAGEVVFAKGYGYADLEHDARNTDVTPFYLASVSKQFTAAAVLLLAQDGKLTLDDDVRKYVPELPTYGKQPITIAELLHHTSGVRDYGLLLSLQGTDDADVATNDDVLWILSHQHSLNFASGARHEYSNSGYVLLSLVVQRVSGKPFGAFVKERIFDPLGMKDTLVKDDHTRIIPGRAVGYDARPDKTFGIAMSDSEYTGPGNVVSTVRDLAKWDANFYDPRVGGHALVDAQRVRGKLTDGKTISYACGLVEDDDHGVPLEWHNGGFVGYRTFVGRYPTERLTVSVLCNNTAFDPDELAPKIARVFLPKLDGPEAPKATGPSATPVPAPAATTPMKLEDPAAFAGMWANAETFEVRTFKRAKDGTLELSFGPVVSDPRVLVPVGPREVVVKDGTTRYALVPGKGRAATTILRKTQDAPPETYVHLDPTPTLDAKTLAAYAGRYGSDELARDTEVLVKDDKLVARTWGGRPMVPLTPVAKDVFSVGGEVGCRFERDARGKVTGLTVTTSRTLGVKLKKR